MIGREKIFSKQSHAKKEGVARQNSDRERGIIMNQIRESETVSMISCNPMLWNEVMIKRYVGHARVRILMAKLGEGHEVAMKTLAEAFWNAGYEVIYTNIQKPEAIVASAIQESVDHIGITLLPGAKIEDLAEL